MLLTVQYSFSRSIKSNNKTLLKFENKAARGGKMYDAEATKDAWDKTPEFLKKNGAKLK